MLILMAANFPLFSTGFLAGVRVLRPLHDKPKSQYRPTFHIQCCCYFWFFCGFLMQFGYEHASHAHAHASYTKCAYNIAHIGLEPYLSHFCPVPSRLQQGTAARRKLFVLCDGEAVFLALAHELHWPWRESPLSAMRQYSSACLTFPHPIFALSSSQPPIITTSADVKPI